ncbi:MAG: zf-TFIIB domain-containing protein [Elusimicrobia bacterium]|nr:zf-TFIIB domain-containing protein [Elusimicrobiota bacterium]
MAGLPCPRCATPLATVQAAELELDVCRSCEGVWFDKDELSRTLKSPAAGAAEDLRASWRGASLAEAEPGPSVLPCPRCAGGMRRFRFGLSSAVLIDGCLKGCGVWLDDGELGAVADHLADHLTPATPGERELLERHRSLLVAAYNRLGERR